MILFSISDAKEAKLRDIIALVSVHASGRGNLSLADIVPGWKIVKQRTQYGPEWRVWMPDDDKELDAPPVQIGGRKWCVGFLFDNWLKDAREFLKSVAVD